MPGDDDRPYIDIAEVKRRRAGKPKIPARTKTPAHLELERAIASDPDLDRLLAFNEFSGEITLVSPIPHPDRIPEEFKPRRWCDQDVVRMVEVLNARGFGKLNKSIVDDVIEERVRDLHGYHPVRQYLESLEWDAHDRLDRWLLSYCGAAADDSAHRRYVEAVSRATLIAAVARIMKPGCKADTMLILEGSQGTLKSSMLRLLAVEDSWFTDSLPHDLASRDARQHLAGKWIVEMSEIAQMRRAEVETLKSFVSCQIDRYRPPYGRSDIAVPRQCILIGSTNEDAYLRDATGNRRFWPVKLADIDLDAIAKNRDQLWAEALQAYLKGEQWWLIPEIDKIAAEQQAARLETDPWTTLIAERCSLRPQVTTAEVLEEILDVKKGLWTKADEMRVATILRNLGYARKRVQMNGLRNWIYTLGR